MMVLSKHGGSETGKIGGLDVIRRGTIKGVSGDGSISGAEIGRASCRERV